MDNHDFKIIPIKNDEELKALIEQIRQGPLFASAFSFENNELRNLFLQTLNINQEEFNEKFYHYNKAKHIHISESENNYIWVSTYGLIMTREHSRTHDKYVRSCIYQYHTLSLLIDKIMQLSQDESTYDIDGYNYNYMNELMPTFFHNILFYMELFGKAYLSMNNIPPCKGHSLNKIYSSVKKCMFELNHNNTLFHAFIIMPFEQVLNYICTIPGSFKEQFVKYDDNQEDTTVIRVDYQELNDMKQTLVMSYDFISCYSFSQEMYLEQGIYEKLLNMAKDDNKKSKIMATYNSLLNENL